MALFDRLGRQEGEADKLPTHAFSEAVRLWLTGAGGADAISRSDIVTFFELSSQDEVQLDALKAVYDAKGTNLEKLNFLGLLHAVITLVEHSPQMTKSRARAILGV